MNIVYPAVVGRGKTLRERKCRVPEVLDVYETGKMDALKELERYNSSPAIQNALSINLPNESEATDYSLWSQGCDDFADDNFAVLKEWVH